MSKLASKHFLAIRLFFFFTERAMVHKADRPRLGVGLVHVQRKRVRRREIQAEGAMFGF
jgi:hypothetical protein